MQAGVVSAIYAYAAKERAYADEMALLAANMSSQKLGEDVKQNILDYIKVRVPLRDGGSALAERWERLGGTVRVPLREDESAFATR